MAVTWSVDSTRSSIYYFDPKDIVIKPELNGRFEPPDLAELKASIAAVGQQQPVIVRNEGGRPVLLAGFNRYLAISELNKDKAPEMRIKIAATYSRCNEQDGFLLNWEENHRRNSTTDLDDAHYFAQMERWGKTPKEIADLLKISEKYVKDHLKLVEVDKAVQEALRAGRIKAPAAVRLAKMSAAQQREAVKGNGKVSVAPEPAKSAPKIGIKQILEFVEQHTGPGEDESVKEFCIELLRYIRTGKG